MDIFGKRHLRAWHILLLFGMATLVCAGVHIRSMQGERYPDYDAIPSAVKKMLLKLHEAPASRDEFMNGVYLPSVISGKDFWRGGLAYLDNYMAASRGFATVDTDSDGELSQAEIDAIAQHEKDNGFRRACGAGLPGKDEQVVFLGAYEGAMLSTYSVAGQSKTTTAIRVDIPHGGPKIYFIALNGSPVIWQLTGDTQRVSTFLAYGPLKEEGGEFQTGVVGVSQPQLKSLEECMHGAFSSKSPQEDEIRKQLHRLLKRDADVFAVKAYMTDATLGDSAASFAQFHVTDAPAGFDPYVWQMLMFEPHEGVADFAGQDIVSYSAQPQPYLVLPGYAGLSQLAGRGMLVHPPGSRHPWTPLKGGNGMYVTSDGDWNKKFWIAHQIPSLPPDISADFVLAKGVPLPPGETTGCIISQETGLQVGGLGGTTNCKWLEYPVLPPSGGSSCRYERQPGFAQKLTDLYNELMSRPQRIKGKDEETVTGTPGPDAFFIDGKNKKTLVYGKEGDDVYFMSLLEGRQEIYEQPSWNETNTLVLTDVRDADLPSLAFTRDDDGLVISYAGGRKGSVTIKNWFNASPSYRKPVACFAFAPHFFTFNAGSINRIAQSQALDPGMAAVLAKARGDQEKIKSAALFPDVSPSTELHYVGVYESSEEGRPPMGVEGNRYGSIEVNVFDRGVPMILVLTSYEPVDWQVNVRDNAQVVGIVLSGYYRQQVESNVSGLRVFNLSRGMSSIPYFFGYETNGHETESKLESLTGIPQARMQMHTRNESAYFEIR